MKVLIKKATIINQGQEPVKRDILIENGKITNIAKSITADKAKIIESNDLHVSPGWIDIGAQPGQPGYEFRETFISLANAARAGGYTSLATFPRNAPPIHSRIEIEYIQQWNDALPIHIYPVGAVSQELAGKDLTEMMDMVSIGAIAFSDGRKSPIETSLLTRALEYVIPLGVVIIDFPLDRSFTSEGQMNEGKVSASMGLTGIPTVAEDVIVQRDMQLLGYTKSKLHLHAVSSGTSIPFIQKARSENLKVTCDVPAMHLLLEDKDVGDFDSYKKVLPPFRGQKDRKAIIRALKDGIIDHISSIHTPLEVEAKDCEFTYASFGSIGLETAFAAANTVLKDVMPVSDIIDKFCFGPARILGLPVQDIEKGNDANLTFFDPGTAWTYNGSLHSLSKNDALSGTAFIGKVIGTFSKGRLLIN
ncbi:MAG TPA: dihydroorotase [Saprospiraceae bacterium]|nr:dihydroorotase [Saprospiraceae bacterium]